MIALDKICQWEFHCDPNIITSGCYPMTFVCDGTKNCDNGRDEENCVYNTTTSSPYSTISAATTSSSPTTTPEPSNSFIFTLEYSIFINTVFLVCPNSLVPVMCGNCRSRVCDAIRSQCSQQVVAEDGETCCECPAGSLFDGVKCCPESQCVCRDPLSKYIFIFLLLPLSKKYCYFIVYQYFYLINFSLDRSLRYQRKFGKMAN